MERTKMSFGGGSVDKLLFDTVCDILPEGNTILELGSGWTTGEFIKRYKVYSVEHSKEWLNKYHNNYIYAPLKQHKEILNFTGYIWYDREVIIPEIPKIKYDLLLIDGPPYTRAGILKYLDFFNLNVPIVIDDVDRTHRDDMKIMIEIAKKIKKPYVVYGAGLGGKMFGVINDPRLEVISGPA